MKTLLSFLLFVGMCVNQLFAQNPIVQTCYTTDPAEVTQDLLDRITDAFFSEAKLYTSDSYYTQTKDEIKKTLDELKEDVANGNLDPYNWGTDEDGNLYYNIYDDI